MPRPTKIIRDECGGVSVSNDMLNFAFIGDTSECTASAYKFYKQGKKIYNKNNSNKIFKIIILFEGQDQITTHGKIRDVSFVANNITFIKSFFRPHNINYISRGDSISESTANQYPNIAQFMKIPRGPCSDFLTLPTIPEICLGYIDLYTAKNSIQFLQENVISVDFNSVEKTVTKAFANSISLGKIGSCEELVGASVPKTHLFFAEKPCGTAPVTTRNILQAYYFKLLDLSLGNTGVVNVFYNVTNLMFKKSTIGLGWDVTFNTPGIKNTNPPPLTYTNTVVKFKTDPYTYVRLVTEGLQGCSTDDSRTPVIVRAPVQYRSLIAAPISIITDSNGVVMPMRKDLVTTSFTFAVPNTSSNESTTYGLAAYPSVAGYVYTSPEDLITGQYAVPGQFTCLTTEMVYYGSRGTRRIFFDPRVKAIIVLFGENRLEQFLKRNTKSIQKSIYQAYGLSASSYPNVDDDNIELINTNFGLKKDVQWFTFTPKYLTQPAIIARTVNGLYFQNNNATNAENLPCCGEF